MSFKFFLAKDSLLSSIILFFLSKILSATSVSLNSKLLVLSSLSSRNLSPIFLRLVFKINKKVTRIIARNDRNIKLFKKGDNIIEADVWLGNKAIIDLVSTEDILFTLKKKNKNKFKAKVVFESPIKSPILKDTVYGKLIITDTINGDIEYPLVAKEDIKKAGIFRKISSAFSYLVFGGYAQ